MRLGVNIDHVATLRQARGTLYPDPLEAALAAIGAGADLITCHLREDRRHIQEEDLFRLKREVPAPLNLEIALGEEVFSLCERLLPDCVCLVPEKREERTTEGGLAVAGREGIIQETIARIESLGVAVSLFLDPELEAIEAAFSAGAKRLELHTGRYADAPPQEKPKALEDIEQAAKLAQSLGMGVHAGHGLHVDNVGPVAAIREIEELNIGHAIVARAIFVGMAEAVAEMRRAIAWARGF